MNTKYSKIAVACILKTKAIYLFKLKSPYELRRPIIAHKTPWLDEEKNIELSKGCRNITKKIEMLSYNATLIICSLNEFIEYL